MLTRRRVLGATAALAAGRFLGCDRWRRDSGAGRLFDVCIVGSGFAGLYLALPLVERGLRVIVLEAGGFTPRREDSPGRAALLPVEVSGEVRFPVDEARCIAVGGASARWRGIVSRLAPEIFEPVDAASGFSPWPIPYSELDPYYCRAEALLNVRGGEYIEGAEPPRSCAYPNQIERYESLDETFDRSGLRFAPLAFASRADPALPYRLADVEVPELLSYSTAELRADSVCLRLSQREPGAVDSAEVTDAAGVRDHVRARIFVVAAGPIDTPRILLDSRSRWHPRGLGNDFGLVGAHFNAHPRESTQLRLPEGPRFPGGLHRTYSFTEGLRRNGLGAAHVDFRLRGQRPGFGIMLELQPSLDNRLTLDGKARDAFGRPALHLHQDWSTTDVRTLTRSREIREELLGRLPGARTVSPLPERRWFHPAGSCRMAPEAARGVVDRDCRIFGVDNLYVAGASVFPSSGSANPTLTVVALALRLAEHLFGRLG